jgi:hypothetical protein
MNMLSFIKHSLMRRIERELRRHEAVRDLFRTLQRRSIENSDMSIATIQREIASLDAEAGRQVEEITHHYRPRILFNMGYEPDELALTGKIKETARERLCIDLEFFGFVFQDAAVHHAIANRQTFLPHNRDSIAAAGILRAAHRIENFWDRPVSDTAERIEADARKTFEAFQPLQIGTANGIAGRPHGVPNDSTKSASILVGPQKRRVGSRAARNSHLDPPRTAPSKLPTSSSSRPRPRSTSPAPPT